jgi:thioesterase domain-containing protein
MKMNYILKSIFMLSLTLLLSIGAKAQDGQQTQMSPQELLDREAKQMKKQLLLTKEQVGKLEQVNKNTIAAMIELRNSQGMDRQARMEKMRNMRTDRESAIKEMLTAEQIEKYEIMRKDRENDRSQQWGARRESN